MSYVPGIVDEYNDCKNDTSFITLGALQGPVVVLEEGHCLDASDCVELVKHRNFRNPFTRRQLTKNEIKFVSTMAGADVDECKPVVDLKKEIGSLSKAKESLESALATRSVVHVLSERTLTTNASEILQAFEDVVSSATVFEEAMKGRCENDEDVVQAKRVIVQCAEHSASLSETLLNAGEELLKHSTYLSYAKKVIKSIARRFVGVVSSLAKAVYKRKVQLTIAVLVGMAVVPVAPTIATSTFAYLGITGPLSAMGAQAAGSLPTLLGKFATLVASEVVCSALNPSFLMTAGVMLGSVVLLEHFSTAKSYLQSGEWTSDKQDSPKDLEKLRKRTGASKKTIADISKSVSDAKKKIYKSAKPKSYMGRAALLIGYMLKNTWMGTKVLTLVLFFGGTIAAILSLLLRVACSLVKTGVGTGTNWLGNLYDRFWTTTASSTFGFLAGAGQMASFLGGAGAATGGAAAATGAASGGVLATGLSGMMGILGITGGHLTLAAAIGTAFVSQYTMNYAIDNVSDRRDDTVKAVAATVELLSEQWANMVPLVTSTSFILMCTTVGALMFSMYSISTDAQEEQEQFEKKIDEMFTFSTSPNIINTPHGFVELVQRLNEAQSKLEKEVQRTETMRYRSVSKTLLSLRYSNAPK